MKRNRFQHQKEYLASRNGASTSMQAPNNLVKTTEYFSPKR